MHKNSDRQAPSNIHVHADADRLQIDIYEPERDPADIRRQAVASFAWGGILLAAGISLVYVFIAITHSGGAPFLFLCGLGLAALGALIIYGELTALFGKPPREHRRLVLDADGLHFDSFNEYGDLAYAPGDVTDARIGPGLDGEAGIYVIRGDRDDMDLLIDELTQEEAEYVVWLLRRALNGAYPIE